MSSTIPPEIISDILVRLPVKPLLRFRSVSKPWCTLIDSPYFIKRHLKRSNRSLYLGGNGYLYSLDYNALGTPIKLKLPVKESFGFDIIGSCNGLLLLEKNATHRKYVSLLNPATRQYRVIPDTQTDYPSDPVVITFEKFGFGYDSVHDDYKVIRVVEFEGRDYSWIGSEARIYSLKTNSWHKVDTFPYCLPYKRVWVHLDGRLHSFVNAAFVYGKDDVSTTSDDANPPRIIVSFDLSTEKCDYITLPNGLDDSYFEMTVEVYEGMLCVQASYEGHRIDIWAMREYGVYESWFKFLSISPPFVDPYATIHPLALSSNGGEVLLCCNDESVIWYDHERKTIKRSPFHGTFPFYVEVCVDSLVPLESAGKSGSVKKNVKEDKSKEVKELRIEKPKKVNEEKPKEKKNKKSDGFLSTGFKLKL